MKRFTYAMVMAVALVVLVSSFAFAGDDCKSKTTASTKAGCSEAEKAACATSATAKTASADKAACAATCASKSAAEKAACEATCTEADKAAYKAASADMHKCCATALADGKGCCGKDADALKAYYADLVTYEKAAAVVMADMHKCCASAMAEGKGCCGHSPEEMKADYDKKVEAEAKKVASSEKESTDS